MNKHGKIAAKVISSWHCGVNQSGKESQDKLPFQNKLEWRKS
jgi:hypothetical protein